MVARGRHIEVRLCMRDGLVLEYEWVHGGVTESNWSAPITLVDRELSTLIQQRRSPDLSTPRLIPAFFANVSLEGSLSLETLDGGQIHG